MNILVPDSWLREFLETKATPKQIKEYLSLCGPSVEKIEKIGKELIYHIEVTGNRPDMISISGIAREAAVILPRFNIPAKFVNDPYKLSQNNIIFPKKILPAGRQVKLKIISDAKLNPRWTSVIIDNVNVKESPKWLKQKLELIGIRSLNNVVDVTNYLMMSFGQPAHAFDFDEIKSKKGIPTMILRESKKGEHLTTLDKISHTLPGGDIIIEDGEGRLIDLCGIMGGFNSSIKPTTKRVLLFMQTYNPQRIRQTMMKLGIRTDAGSLFEKDLDTEMVLPTVIAGIKLITELTNGKVASQIFDLYPAPYIPYKVTLSRSKLDIYIGNRLSDQEIINILLALGIQPQITDDFIEVTVPSHRKDIQIDVDIIEEIARIYGYHQINPVLPQSVIFDKPDTSLQSEQDIKIRLRDWGFSETYTYSMISENLMDIFKMDKNRSYKISNPLSEEWVYMRPSLLPSLLSITQQNLKIKPDFQIFELSHIYEFKVNDLPHEKSILSVLWTGDKFRDAKGLAQNIFSIYNIPFPQNIKTSKNKCLNQNKSLHLDEFGELGLINKDLLNKLNVHIPITVLNLDFDKFLKKINLQKKYIPIPKYPPIIEDLTFIFPQETFIGKVINYMYETSKLVNKIELHNQYQNATTFRINYLDPNNNLSTDLVSGIRSKLINNITSKFHGELKGNI